jgi:O-antigen ligase
LTKPSRVTPLFAWSVLVLLTVLYGPLGRYAPYVLLALLPIAVAHLLHARVRWPVVGGGGAHVGFVMAFALLALASALAARQPSDVLIVVNFIWLLLFIPLLSLLAQASWSGAGVAFARLTLAGAVVTLAWAVFDRTITGAERSGVLTSDPIRIANTAVLLGFVALTGVVADHGWKRAVYLLGPAAAVVAALLAGTRGAIIGACVLAAVATILAARSWRAALVTGSAVALLALTALIVATQLHIPRLDSIIRTIVEIAKGEAVTDGSAMIRVRLISASVAAFFDSPWFGHGWQSIIAAVTPYLPPDLDTQGSPHLHNDVADFAVGAGVIGLLAYATILATPIIAAWRSPPDNLRRVRLFAATMLVAGYAVLGINSMMFGYEIHTSLYCGLCAAILGFVRKGDARWNQQAA